MERVKELPSTAMAVLAVIRDRIAMGRSAKTLLESMAVLDEINWLVESLLDQAIVAQSVVEDERDRA